MGEKYDMVSGTAPDLARSLGVRYPNPRGLPNITAVVVAWNEEERIGALLEFLSGWFSHLVVGVQKSTDRTREIAEAWTRRPTDTLIDEPHHGFGDASFPRLVAAVQTPWTFVVSCDEMPSDDMMEALGIGVAYASQFGYDGVWLYFHSFTEGVEWKVPHGHLRLFYTKLGWPSTMHSRPWARRAMWWPIGHIDHVRSLDELVRDYLRYNELGRGNPGWENHNLSQMRDACVAVAESKGWEFVQALDWWATVRDLVFEGKEPDHDG
jgi:hypothetical protein